MYYGLIELPPGPAHGRPPSNLPMAPRPCYLSKLDHLHTWKSPLKRNPMKKESELA